MNNIALKCFFSSFIMNFFEIFPLQGEKNKKSSNFFKRVLVIIADCNNIKSHNSFFFTLKPHKETGAVKINVSDYYSPEEWSIFKAESAKHETPFVVVNLDIIRRKYEELRKFFPFAKVYYAMNN